MANISPWGSFTWGAPVWGESSSNITTIYDRTQNDIDHLKSVTDDIRSGISIPQEYLEGLRGAVNYTDLNRIEENVQYISDIFNNNGYLNTVTTKTNWLVSDILTLADINRIRTNIDALIDCFIAFDELLPMTYNNTLTYQQVNAMEFDLYFLNYSFNKIVVGLFYSGEKYSGEGD